MVKIIIDGVDKSNFSSFADNTFNIFDESDNTKELAFDVGTNVSTGTTRTLKIPNLSGEIALMGVTQSTNFTTTGTVTAEQITSTDDITMQGHLLTMGDSGAATDTVLSFLGSTNSATITYDESADLFNYGDAGITTTGIVNIGDTTPSTTSFLNVDGRVIITGTQTTNDPLLDIGTTGANDSNNILLRSGAGTFSFFVAGGAGDFMGLTTPGDGGIRVSINNSLLFGSNVNPRLILNENDEMRVKGQLIAESGGPELMSDPLFNANPGGWTLGTGWSITDGRLKNSSTVDSNAFITLGHKTDGTTYRVELTFVRFERVEGGPATAVITMGGQTIFSFDTSSQEFGAETLVAYVTPTNGNDFKIEWGGASGSSVIDINSIFVKEMLPTIFEGSILLNTGKAIKSGATQGASGAAEHEIWKTASHATLPDNVLMIGV